ncbi:hypothetical protein [Seleniivibrio sp.]|nr:hypothetical protein [Seleniivibrio sp.]
MSACVVQSAKKTSLLTSAYILSAHPPYPVGVRIRSSPTKAEYKKSHTL